MVDQDVSPESTGDVRMNAHPVRHVPQSFPELVSAVATGKNLGFREMAE